MHLTGASNKEKNGYKRNVVTNSIRIILAIISFVSLGYMNTEQFNLWVAIICLSEILLGNILSQIHDAICSKVLKFLNTKNDTSYTI